jgi:hypothetical protein
MEIQSDALKKIKSGENKQKPGLGMKASLQTRQTPEEQGSLLIM